MRRRAFEPYSRAPVTFKGIPHSFESADPAGIKNAQVVEW